MIRAKINTASASQLRATLKAYEKATGKGIETGIREIGKSVAIRLAETVQPFGIKSAKGKSFEKSIGIQVDRAWFGANLGAWSGSTMEQAHKNARNSKGQVPKRLFRKEKSSPWLGVISETERNIYKRKAQGKAGRAKSAWIDSGNSLGVGHVSNVANWISRHLGGGYGSSIRKKSAGISSVVTLVNDTPYLSSIQPRRTINSSIRTGYKNGLARLEIIIAAVAKKYNKP